MTLNPKEQVATKRELKENFKIANLEKEKVAKDLKTSVEHLEDVLNLDSERIEEPWVLKNYLNTQITNQGKKSFPYSKLIGDYHDYWFLNNEFIDNGKLVNL